MIASVGLILVIGLFFGEICKRLKLPGLIGMLLCGILIGPYGFHFLDDSILHVSADIRKMALIVILLRSGLNLHIEDLKKVGRAAILMCFIPAIFEMMGTVLFAHVLLGMNLVDSLILGSVLAAVSPAVVVPKMLKLIEEKKGSEHGIPQLIMAGASVDDVIVIALFSAFTSLASQNTFSWESLVCVPLSIFMGICGGVIMGFILLWQHKRFHVQPLIQLSITLGCAFLMVTLEDRIKIPFASLIGVMAMGIVLQKQSQEMFDVMSSSCAKIWQVGEVFLFVLVGASVNIQYALHLGWTPIVLIFSVLIFRMIGVQICLIKTHLTNKERTFCMIAYTPKATVQAAIGGLPLAMGLACGERVLSVAVLAILITAPLGAIAIEKSASVLLE